MTAPLQLVESRRQWRHPRGEYVSIATAANRLGVSELLIRTWIHRKGVTKAGTRRTGWKYDFERLVDIEHETRTSIRGRRS